MSLQSRRMRKLQNSNRAGLLVVCLIVIVLGAAMAVGSASLRQKSSEYEQQKEALAAKIAGEQQRSLDLEDYQNYTKSKKFIEEMAKEKLGLVNPDEIIFKAQ
ncbi:cell division protein DivIC [Cuneatibacter caecimuris]|uniref:Cell division protein DivIC n=2 Tax=Cuneatibacter caecimuris TaxID=1796618 RepID=A0A4Q7PPP4_9FIRM|nr:cell division protein DivIC [Cuneatibacter caecimuris]